MRLVLWVGMTALVGAVAAGCGISPAGEAAASGDDGGGSDASSSGSSSGSSGGGSSSGSSSGGIADARADGKTGMDASKGGGDAGVDSPGDATMSDGPGTDAPPDVPSSETGCTGPSDCPPGMACQLDGTCGTHCSNNMQCNQGCCDDPVSGNCHPTSNNSCNGNGGLCTACTCTKTTDCPLYWACGMCGFCTQACDPAHLCNQGCCSDINMGQCIGTDCSQSPEGPVCNNKGFCGCSSPSDCTNAGYGPDCKGMPSGAGNGCQCTENGNSGTGDCTGVCTICDGMPTRCHC